MASSNGGRRRGRPRIYTPERKLELERERDRFKKAAKRKREADAKWQRSTNFGYFVQLWVPHYDELLKVLVEADFLDECDTKIAPRVDTAVDELFDSFPEVRFLEVRFLGGRSRKLSRSGPGTIRIRMTAGLADWLVAWGSEGEFKRMVLDRRDYPWFDPATDEKELAEFLEGLRHDRAFLRKMAESVLVQWYSSFVFDPPRHPCNCKLALPACDCISRFKPDPKVKKPIVRGFNATVPLYSAPVPRWWTAQKPRYDNDPIIRSHDRSASVGMKGFHAGSSRGAWKNENAIYYSEQDNRPTTRDWNKTAGQGEKALNGPYDDPRGTPKSWSNPKDAEPDNEDGIIWIGNRLIEDAVIEPSKDKDEN